MIYFTFFREMGCFCLSLMYVRYCFLFFISLVLAISHKLKVKSVDISEDSCNYLCYPSPSSPVPSPCRSPPVPRPLFACSSAPLSQYLPLHTRPVAHAGVPVMLTVVSVVVNSIQAVFSFCTILTNS